MEAIRSSTILSRAASMGPSHNLLLLLLLQLLTFGNPSLVPSAIVSIMAIILPLLPFQSLRTLYHLLPLELKLNNTMRDVNPSMADSFRSDSMSSNQAPQSKGILNNRYADHPNCDVCNVRFDVTKRRHQCRTCGLFVCSSCSPVRLLVPPGKQIEGAKNYDPSVPQRVCIQCAPGLHPLQDELVATKPMD
eukprot:jgi/Phyca11/537271/estExt2_fgenesh1_pg.C_PHYCAscaffold_810014